MLSSIICTFILHKSQNATKDFFVSFKVIFIFRIRIIYFSSQVCDVTNLVVGTRATALVVARDVDGQPITHGGEEISATILTRDGTTL